jgi:DNA polymerase III delta prime subunit
MFRKQAGITSWSDPFDFGESNTFNASESEDESKSQPAPSKPKSFGEIDFLSSGNLQVKSTPTSKAEIKAPPKRKNDKKATCKPTKKAKQKEKVVQEEIVDVDEQTILPDIEIEIVQEPIKKVEEKAIALPKPEPPVTLDTDEQFKLPEIQGEYITIQKTNSPQKGGKKPNSQFFMMGTKITFGAKKDSQFLSWSEKYAPKSLNEFVGNEESKYKVTEWLQNFRKQKAGTPLALLIVGPSGVGKSILVKLLADEYGYDLTELNPTTVIKKPTESKEKVDLKRIAECIESTTAVENLWDIGNKNAITRNSFVYQAVLPLLRKHGSKPPMILVDQADIMGSGTEYNLLKPILDPKNATNTTSRSRQGKTTTSKGVPIAVTKVTKSWTNPLIFVSNELDPKKLEGIKKFCLLVTFSSDNISRANLIKRMEFVLKNEKITASNKTLELIADVCAGDVRKCLDALEQCARFSLDGNRRLKKKKTEISLDSMVGHDKFHVMNVYKLLEKLFHHLYVKIDSEITPMNSIPAIDFESTSDNNNAKIDPMKSFEQWQKVKNQVHENEITLEKNYSKRMKNGEISVSDVYRIVKQGGWYLEQVI